MYRHLAVPRVDTLAYTATGLAWIDQEWLSELIFTAAYQLAHWAGVLLLTAAACALSITLLTFQLLRHLRFSAAVAWAAVTEVAISPHFLARPHVFSFLIIVCWLVILLDSYDSRKLELSSVLLAPLMILWANLHGSFVYGLGVYGVFFVFAFGEAATRHEYVRCRRLILACVIVSASAIITPYGINSVLVVLEISQFRFVLSHVSEWRSPDFQNYWLYSLYLVGLFTAALFFGVRVRGPRLALLGLNLLFGLAHLRGLVLFFLTAPILLAKPFALECSWLRANLLVNADERDGDPVLRTIRQTPFYIPVLFASIIIPATAWLRWDQLNTGPSQAVAPRMAVDFIEKTGLKGNVFNTYNFGGYLIFRGIPVFIDSRQPPYSDEFVHKAFDAIYVTDIAAGYGLLDHYRVSWAILVPKEPLAKVLRNNADWRELYSDKDAIVFTRNRPLN